MCSVIVCSLSVVEGSKRKLMEILWQLSCCWTLHMSQTLLIQIFINRTKQILQILMPVFSSVTYIYIFFFSSNSFPQECNQKENKIFVFFRKIMHFQNVFFFLKIIFLYFMCSAQRMRKFCINISQNFNILCKLGWYVNS